MGVLFGSGRGVAKEAPISSATDSSTDVSTDFISTDDPTDN